MKITANAAGPAPAPAEDKVVVNVAVEFDSGETITVSVFTDPSLDEIAAENGIEAAKILAEQFSRTHRRPPPRVFPPTGKRRVR